MLATSWFLQRATEEVHTYPNISLDPQEWILGYDSLSERKQPGNYKTRCGGMLNGGPDEVNQRDAECIPQRRPILAIREK